VDVCTRQRTIFRIALDGLTGGSLPTGWTVTPALAVQYYCATTSAIGLHEYLYDPALLWELVEKFSTDLRFDSGNVGQLNVRHPYFIEESQ